ncbi:MAG: HdaA/DnaA family protein [Oceanococcus sp.]
MSVSQQHLRLERPGNSDFASFWAGPNLALVDAVKAFTLNDDDGPQLLLGPAGSGKSHLAQACCRLRWDQSRQAAYLPVADAPLQEDLLQGFTSAGLIVVDDLQALRPADELPLLRLVDRSRAANGKLLLCGRVWPDQLVLQTPDLRSRLQWGAMLELKALDEGGLASMLQHRAKLLGVHWSPRLAEFLLRRVPRDPAALVGVLEQAYQRAVETGRQITVPLLRDILDTLTAHE